MKKGTVKDKRCRKCKATPSGIKVCDKIECSGGRCPMRYKTRELRQKGKRNMT